VDGLEVAVAVGEVCRHGVDELLGLYGPDLVGLRGGDEPAPRGPLPLPIGALAAARVLEALIGLEDLEAHPRVGLPLLGAGLAQLGGAPPDAEVRAPQVELPARDEARAEHLAVAGVVDEGVRDVDPAGRV